MGPIRVYDFAEKHMYWNLDCSCVINTEKKTNRSTKFKPTYYSHVSDL